MEAERRIAGDRVVDVLDRLVRARLAPGLPFLQGSVAAGGLMNGVLSEVKANLR
jgi:hypothetical protein